MALLDGEDEVSFDPEDILENIEEVCMLRGPPCLYDVLWITGGRGLVDRRV